MMENLTGATILAIDGLHDGSEEVLVRTSLGTLRMFHDHDCCETVNVVDVDDDGAGLVGGLIGSASEEASAATDVEAGSATWTFYKFNTTRGDLTIRWLGQSNGYYSESVALEWTEVAP